MAWYEDPLTGELVEKDFFDKKKDSMMFAQATMLVVPFSTPFKTIDYSNVFPFHNDNLHEVNASHIAQAKGYDAFKISWTSDPDAAIVSVDYLPWNVSLSYHPYATQDPLTSFLVGQSLPGGNIAWFNESLSPTQIDNGIVKFSYPPEFTGQEDVDHIRNYGGFSALCEYSPKSDGDYLNFAGSKQYSFNEYDILAPLNVNQNYDKEFLLQDWKHARWGTNIDSPSGYKYSSTDSFYNDVVQPSNRLHLRNNKLILFGNNTFKHLKYVLPIHKLQNVGIIPNQPQGNLTPIGTWVLENLYNFSYRDCAFEIKKPFLEKAYESILGAELGLSSPVNIKSHYNFYLLPYESAISDYPSDSPGEQILIAPEFNSTVGYPVPEPLLPNIYALIYDQISEELSYRYSDQGSWMPYGAWKTKDGKLGLLKENGFPKWASKENWLWASEERKFLEYLSQYLSISTKKKDINSTPVKNIASYLNAWVKDIKILGAPEAPPVSVAFETYGILAHMGTSDGIKSPTAMIKEGKYNVVGISAYKMKDFTDEANKLKKMFPFYVDIDLPMTNKGFVGQALFEGGLTDIFMQNVMAALWPIYSDYGGPITGQKGESFFKKINILGPPFIDRACVIKKDSFYDNTIVSGDKDDVTIHGEQNTMFNEPLVSLWLNDALEIDILLDLDSAPAIDDEGVPFADKFSGLPPQYYDWINYKAAPMHIDQIKKFRGMKTSNTVFGTANLNTDDLSVLKPVVFGKAPPKSSIVSLLKWVAAKAKINKFINEKTRNVVEVYRGKKAYSEVLFYEIVKYQSQSNGLKSDGSQKANNYPQQEKAGYSPDTPLQTTQENLNSEFFTLAPTSGPVPSKGHQGWIQSFFIPNIPGVNIASYVDTQVKHDKGYYYQVYAHTLTVGTKYQFDNFDSVVPAPLIDEPWGGNIKVEMSWRYKADVNLIRVPYYNTIATANGVVSPPKQKVDNFAKSYNMKALETTVVWNNPPIFPDVSFIPLYGEKNKILINTNFNTGQYDLEPLILKETESIPGMVKLGDITTMKSRISQKRLKGPISYKGDDFCGSIQIFRTEKKPTSYQDFMPSAKNVIATAGHGKSNFGFVDSTLEPNKNYYYMVREKDVHKNYSNPSPIYMARIIYKDGEPPYTIFKVFFIDELQEDKSSYYKKFMKYIRIQPSIEQRSISEYDITENTASELKGNVDDCFTFAVGEDSIKKSVWGRKFKFRFTSKKTGRKIDLNLQVKNIEKLDKDYKTTAGEPDTYSSGKC